MSTPPSSDFQPHPPAQPKKRVPVWILVVGVLAAVFCCGGLGFAAVLGGGDSSTSGSPTTAAPKASRTTKAAGTTPTTSKKPSPTKPASPLDTARAKAVAEGVDGLTFAWSKEEKGRLEATYKIRDNFSNRLIRTGIANDTWKIAGVVRGAKVKYTTLRVKGTFPMQDQYGKDLGQRQVYSVDLTKDTIDKMNLDNPTVTTWDNLPDLAVDGQVFLHLSLRED